jgi:hypothetical protein
MSPRADHGLTREAIAEAVEFTYRKLDVIDQQTRDSGARPFVAFVDLPELSSLVSTALGAGLARPLVTPDTV